MAGDELKNKIQHKSASVKVFDCPACGSGVVLRAAGQSVTAVCGSCSAIIDSSNENYKVIEKSTTIGRREQVIPLGQRGKLHGTLWEVIGYVERNGSDVYMWSEYLLFNPLKGFRWLTENDGHWNYIIMIKSKPQKINSKIVTDMYKNYHLFHKGTAKVVYVVGEFYWKVKKGETVLVEDYVSPPEILSSEKSDNEIIWSLGQYVDSEEVKSVFQITKPMPTQIGVAPNQPSKVSHSIGDIKKNWGIFIGIIFVLQLVFLVLSKNQIVYSGQFNFSPLDSEKIKVSPQFELAQGTSNIEINLFASVQNNWLEIQGDLVNDDNGKTTEFEQGVEYYSGRDSEGSWSEGKLYNKKVISSVPSGKYHLNLEATSGQSSDVLYNIEIKRDVITWSNFLWALFLISIYPLFVWWRSRSFEINRWSQSDFSPYDQHQEKN